MPNGQTIEQRVAQHYTLGNVERRILGALKASGKDLRTVTTSDLSAVDQVHTGGREASAAIAAQLGLNSDKHVLDVGCGLGGDARFIAETYGCRVTGIDVTEEYVRTATALSGLVGLGHRTLFRYASALDVPFGPDTFDAAYMMHVGMNIADKDALFAEIRRVLKFDGMFAVNCAFRCPAPRFRNWHFSRPRRNTDVSSKRPGSPSSASATTESRRVRSFGQRQIPRPNLQARLAFIFCCVMIRTRFSKMSLPCSRAPS
jgi:SAM-dependent methyltransferase